MADFSKAIDGVLVREGGYVNDPKDAGGETNFGISKRAYPYHDIKNLTKQDAVDIYDEDYWRPILAGDFESQALANVVFDFAVNSGRSRAVRLLQQICRVQIDGQMGPITLGAANAGDSEKLAMQYTLQRVQFYCDLARKRKSNRKFLAGWINRALGALYD